MNDRHGGLGCMMIILFLGASSTTVLCKLHLTDCLLFLMFLNIYMCVYTSTYVWKNLPDAAGRPHLLEVRTARTKGNGTALDASKVTLVFCQKRYCDLEPHDCYCCLPDLVCYNTWSECRTVCARCNPKCPAQSRSPLWMGIVIDANDYRNNKQASSV